MVINIMRISIYIIILVIFFVVKVIVVGVFEKKFKMFYRKWNKIIKDLCLLFNDKSIFLLSFFVSDLVIFEEF